MEALLSPRELADALGVSESSIKRWVDGGELVAQRTAGGHRRIPRSEAIRFVRSSGMAPARPELLRLAGARVEDSALDEEARGKAFHQALLDDDSARAIGLLTSAFLAGTPAAALCDRTVMPALAEIGTMWAHDAHGILVEHRATDTCLQALGILRSALPPPSESAAVAVGSAGPDDPYLLPSMMCALVLAELGLREVNLGPMTPIAVKVAAAEACHPVIVWHAASIGGEEIAELTAALARSRAAGARLVVGGRACSTAPLPASATRLQSMAELAAFARGVAGKP